jgi:hypothetical protein
MITTNNSKYKNFYINPLQHINYSAIGSEEITVSGKSPETIIERSHENNIKKKIQFFISKYTETLNEFSKEELESNLECEIIETNKFSRNLVTNYANKSQSVFNYIVSCSISRVIYYLGLESNIFKKKLDKMLLYKPSLNLLKRTGYKNKYYSILIKIAIESLNNDNIQENNKDYYAKLIYILFFYLGIQRQIIFILQKNVNLSNSSFAILPNPPTSIRPHFIKDPVNTEYKPYGIIVSKFFENYESIYSIFHPFDMERLQNYCKRLIYNIKTINKINNEIIKINNKTIEISQNFSCKIFFGLNNIIPFYKEINKKIYIILSLKININNNKIIGFNNLKSDITNESLDLNSRLQFLDIISYCLRMLDNQSVNIENSKEYIIIIYYLIIFIMPFYLGTASIAEIFLYSLWKKYIGTNIKINQNIMLDVEALTLPYQLFKKNCFEKDTEEGNIEYTPYLIEV